MATKIADQIAPSCILHVITGLNDGGAEAVLFRLCTQGSSHRHHAVSLMDEGKYGPLLAECGVSVTCLGMIRGRISLSGLWRLWWLIRTAKPDAIQTWMYHANLVGGVVARLAGQRNIIWGIHHTTLMPGESRRGTILVSWLCARLSRIVPRSIICCAERSRKVHADLGYDDERMRVIPNGYDLSVFRPDSKAGEQLRRDLRLEPTERMIGFVARYDPLKDHETLLSALAVLKRQRRCPVCLLVGTGMEPGNAALADRIASLGLDGKVCLLGRRNDIPAVMNALDVHVMSSSAEAFPNVLAEAMACGTPCISTDVGDAAEIIGGTGRIVPPRDPDALAKAIAELLIERDTAAWPDRCEEARHRIAERYSIQRMFDEYQSVWFADDSAQVFAPPNNHGDK